MSRAAANGDPSMDEILASIRKIIAEEPAAAKPVLEPRARGPMPLPPAPPERTAAEPAAERPSAMFGRLAEALRGTRPAAAAPPARNPSSRLDDDLSDLIETTPALPPPAPARVPPSALQPASARFSPSTPPVQAKAAEPSTARAKGEPDTWTGAYPRRPAQHIDTSREEPARRAEFSPAAASPPPAVKTPAAGVPPKALSKSEPPQGTAPEPGKVARQDGSPSPAATGMTRPGDKLGPPPNGGFMPAASSARPASNPVTPPVKPEVIAAMPPPASPTSLAGPGKSSETGNRSAAAASSGAPVPSAAPAKVSPPAAAPAAKSPEAAPPAAPLKSEAQKPVLPAASGVDGQAQSSARAAAERSPAQRAGETPAGPARLLPSGPPASASDTSAAAASALGALAAGLAASSNKPSGGVLPEPPPLPPLSLPPLAARLEAATPLPPALPPSAAAHQPRATTSLEALVADLLQPMLRQWLGDNLPRIVEEAVRGEIAANAKGGPPPRG